MAVQLFVNMLNLENKIKTFPIIDYKTSFSLGTTNENKQNFKIYKQLHSKTRQTDIS